tara:strand:+ start:1828 stop:2442 length:615 start_codon:yes stop_codon:yes gene_type:complete
LDAFKAAYTENVKMKPDLLDMEKYEKRGAYHWDKYDKQRKTKDGYTGVVKYFCDVEPNAGQDIVEVGCGDGLWIHLLEKNGYKICGVDANEVAVKLAHEKGVKNVTHSFILDYKIKHDVCIMFDAFEHFEEPEKCVEKLTELISDRIYLLNPLWESPKYHFDFYDTPKLVNLFKDNWDLTHEKIFNKHTKRRKSFMQFTRRKNG